MAKKPPNLSKLSFEDAIGELEALIDQIEAGEIGLEESLKCYERGSALIERCRSVLDGVQKRIGELTPGPDGTLTADDGENQGETAWDADDGDNDARD